MVNPSTETIVHKVFDSLTGFIQAALPALAIIVIALFLIKLITRKPTVVAEGQKFREQILTLVIVLTALVSVILTLPLDATARGQLFTLLGLLLTAIITLSSPTIAANAMAGFMLRSLRNFAPGDFLQVGEYFGRVTEQDLFHTEIQTADRDLLTIPNTYLANNPVKVVHASGTMVSAEVSLGYDVNRHLIEETLLSAANAAHLEEAFVTITELGDYSVVYKITGLLKQVKNILSTRSSLRKHMLDELHAQNIEIVSPAFMNQRRVEQSMIPKALATPTAPLEEDDTAQDNIIFDIAERAQQIMELKETYKEMKSALETASKDKNTEGLEDKKRRLQAMERLIAYMEKNND